MTESKKKEIVKAILVGAHLHDAARAHGTTYEEAKHWIEEDPRLQTEGPQRPSPVQSQPAQTALRSQRLAGAVFLLSANGPSNLAGSSRRKRPRRRSGRITFRLKSISRFSPMSSKRRLSRPFATRCPSSRPHAPESNYRTDPDWRHRRFRSGKAPRIYCRCLARPRTQNADSSPAGTSTPSPNICRRSPTGRSATC